MIPIDAGTCNTLYIKAQTKMKYPKISIITPCYNMEPYIEQTIISVLNQNYPNLEYIVIDGGSSDSTVEIIKKYSQFISLFICEEDDGMYHAIHKGFMHASGDILAWINADDMYFPWTLHTVAHIFNKFPMVEWIHGLPAFINESGSLTHIYDKLSPKPRKFIEKGYFRHGVLGFLQQESMFWKRDLYYRSGGLNLNYKLAADFDLWTRFAKYAELVSLDLPLAAFRRRLKSQSKVSWDKYFSEVLHSAKRCGKLYPNPLWKFAKSTELNLLLRHLTYGKGSAIYYHLGSEQFAKKKIWGSIAPISIRKLFQQRS